MLKQSKLLAIIFRTLAIISRITRSRNIYMKLYCKSLKFKGIILNGTPRFIHYKSMLDASSKLVLGDNIVISTNVLILTHDYSYTTGLIAIDKKPKTDIAIVSPVVIGNNCFIGAGSIILPGSIIGNNVIIGAGTVVKGNIPNYSVVIGNPCKIQGTTKELGSKNLNRYTSDFLHFDKS